MYENFVNIEIKEDIPSEIILEFCNETKLKPTLQAFDGSFDNFCGPEPDVLIFIQNTAEAFLFSGLYDLLKYSLPKLWVKIKGTKSLNTKDSISINIIMKDEKNRSLHMVIDGTIPYESITDVIDKSFQLLENGREDLFNNPYFQEKDDSDEQNVRLFYNHSTQSFEPFNFSESKKFWNKIEDDINNMDG